MNKLGQSIYEILNTTLSPITAKMIVEEKCKVVGKDADSIEQGDLNELISAVMGPVLLFGGEAAAQEIKKKLEALK